MDTSGVSPLLYRRSEPRGKVRRRVQDLRIPSSPRYDVMASRPALDLSHNESARLAVDSLLSRGVHGYREVLRAEGEVDFLSQLEKNYILEHGRDARAGARRVEPVLEEPDVELHLQSDLRATSMKDLVREFMRKAEKVCVCVSMSVCVCVCVCVSYMPVHVREDAPHHVSLRAEVSETSAQVCALVIDSVGDVCVCVC
ncbi:Protein FAM83A [Liparis tanakae]|uniref:Protein FAM83A n=1 Tax=Liparis tanakae TaxID=230148 RepID=A0A4Z2EVF0_9TELE|nr:Protein FAM83A [Liparis tanakae]